MADRRRDVDPGGARVTGRWAEKPAPADLAQAIAGLGLVAGTAVVKIASPRAAEL